MSHVTLPRLLINQLLHQAQASLHREVCGLIGSHATIFRAYPVDNIAEDPAHLFCMDPKGQIDAMRTMRERGEALFAIYHSHPEGPAFPSPTDLEQAAYPDALYLIIAPATKGALEMRGFYLCDRRVEEVALQF